MTATEASSFTHFRSARPAPPLAEGGFPGAYRMGTGPKAVWKIPQASVIAWITRRQT